MIFTIFCFLTHIKLSSTSSSRIFNFRNQLLNAGLPIEHTPSHIIPVRLGNAEKCLKVSDLLIREYNHYVQAINYPTVPVGEEKLRLAPTPFHTKKMIDILVKDMTSVSCF